jgi:multicomponent Na+:H+ antiporter subunit F
MIYGILITLIGFSVLRILLGPSIWDRLLGLNLLTAKVTILLVFIAFNTGLSYLIDIAITYTLLSFIGIVFISNYIERKETI